MNYFCDMGNYYTEDYVKKWTVFQDHTINGLVLNPERKQYCNYHAVHIINAYLYRYFLISNITEEDALVIALQKDVISMKKLSDDAHVYTRIVGRREMNRGKTVFVYKNISVEKE